MKKVLTLIITLCVSLVIFATPAEETNETLSIVTLKGPTTMGLAPLMNEESDSYSFSIEGSADASVALLLKGEADIALLPANLSSVLYNNTKGNIRVLCINTLGVLYLLENGDSISSLSDLEGKTIYSAGKGGTPEYTLRYVLEEAGLKNVNIEWKAEHAEALSALLTHENCVAMIPQPFATNALEKNGVRIALDLNEAWKELTGYPLITGVAVTRKDTLKTKRSLIDKFLADYKRSVEFVNENIEEAAVLIGNTGVVATPLAKKTIPLGFITYIDGSEMKEILNKYLEILSTFKKDAIGGNLPDEEFYY